jgi:hypothetical protein
MVEIDPDRSVHDLTEANPGLIPVLKALGFAGVGNSIARNTVGRTVTLRKGCERQGKDINEVIRALAENGFTVKK